MSAGEVPTAQGKMLASVTLVEMGNAGETGNTDITTSAVEVSRICSHYLALSVLGAFGLLHRLPENAVSR